MLITFASDSYPMDSYEVNDTVATARRINSHRPVGSGPAISLGIDPRVTIDATIHASSDIDFYIVRGALLTGAERILLAGFPALKLYGNDSRINLEVFRLNADNSQGALVASLNGAGCAPEPFEVRLDDDGYYLVKVSGSPGRYTLRNGVGGDVRRFPVLVRDGVYEVLHPGEPIEQVLRFPQIFVFAADRAFKAVRAVGQHVHMRLSDVDGEFVADGVAGDEGETLSLATASPGQVYALDVTAKNAGADRPRLDLKWDAAEPMRTSGNLIINPGAEIVTQDRNDEVAGWEDVDGLTAPQLLAYADGDGNGSPSPTDPGPNERGAYFFASGDRNVPSGIQQMIFVNREWTQGIEEARVRANLTGFLGGSLDTPDLAVLAVTFLNANQRPLGDLLLPTVGPREREGKTGLLPVESDNVVPAGTAIIRVTLTLNSSEGRRYHQVYADNLGLTLSEYSQ